MAKSVPGLTHLFAKDKTFRPKKKFDHGTLRYELHKQAKASLHSGISLKDCVKLPPAEDLNDWVAVHLVDFFNRINLIYGTISESCTEESCPTMSGGPKYEYHWADGDKYKKPTSVPAHQYIALLMDWIEATINNEDIFPTTPDVPFPKIFSATAKKILTRLFRVFVHVYIHHFDKVQAIGAIPNAGPVIPSAFQKLYDVIGNVCCAMPANKEAHVNQCFKHYYYFITEYNMIDRKEVEPLKQMIDRMC